MATAGSRALPRGMPCWSTKPLWPTPSTACWLALLPIRLSSDRKDVRETGAGTAEPRPVALSGLLRLSPLPAHLVQHAGGEVSRLHIGQGQERLGPLHSVDLEDLAEQQLTQVRVVPDPEPDQQVEAAGDHAHRLGLGQRPD